MVTLVKRMQREGYEAYVAAPANEDTQYLPQNQFVELNKFLGRLRGRGKLKYFDGRIVCLDKAAESFAKGLKAPSVSFFDDIGIDLSVWSPKAISGNRLTMLMAKYHIPPQSKMILVIEPTEKDIRSLVLAMEGLERHDFILALYGKLTKNVAKRVAKRIESLKIAYLGDETDLPSLMRASFAVLSLAPENSFSKIAALAMGRVAAFPACGIKPNIVIKNNLSSVLEQVLTMPAKTRDACEAENLKRVGAYDLDKNITKLKKLVNS
jgi:hypothetical protein